MREFAFDLIPFPPIGLRPDTRSVRRSEYLVRAKNLRGTEHGLDFYVNITDPFSGGVVVSYPFPQVIRGQGVSLSMGEITIGTINEGVTPWTVGSVTTYNPDNPSATKVIPAGGEWHFADCLDHYYLCNGSSVVFKPGIEKLEGLTDKTYVQTDVSVNTVCDFRGRVLAGGFVAADFWTNLESILRGWQADLHDAGVSTSFGDVGGNYILWSSIGGGDFPLWLFFPALYGSSYTAPSADRFIERLKRNELGWMPMPFQGDVLNIKPLDENVIVYGENGVVALTTTARGMFGEMSPTFGRKILAPFGIAQRSAVGVSSTSHIFIDPSGCLWMIGTDLTLQRLGYEEFLYNMLSENIRISHNSNENEFTICSESYGYLLTPQGLYEHHQRVTSGHFVQGGFVGLAQNDSTVGAEEGLLVSSSFDMSVMGLKTLTWVNVDARSLSDLYVAIDYRYDRNSAWRRSPWKPVNKEGNVRSQVAALEFRVCVRTPNFSDLQIDHISVRWQKDDLRTIRGPDADPSVTGTS